MLQVAGRETRIKHKALLMGPTPPTDTLSKPDFNSEPQQLPGDAFERMCTDPEIIRFRRLLYMGVGSVAGVIVLATTLQMGGVWSDPETDQPLQPSTVSAQHTEKPEPAIAPAVTLNTVAPKPHVPEESIKKLSFRAARRRDQTGDSISEPQLALEKFLAAPTVDQKLALVVNPKAVEEQMRDYYARHPLGAVAYQQIETGMRSSASFIEFRVVLNDGTKKFAAVVPTSEGPRVDWASFVSLGDLEWEQMRQARPQKPVLMRILAAPASHFAGHFSNAASLRCVQLVPASNPSAAPVFGYVPKATDLDKDLDYWLRSAGGEMAPMTVKLSYSPETESSDQAWITELVPGWVTVAARLNKEGE